MGRGREGGGRRRGWEYGEGGGGGSMVRGGVRSGW